MDAVCLSLLTALTLSAVVSLRNDAIILKLIGALLRKLLELEKQEERQQENGPQG